MNVLELFSGTKSVGKVCDELGWKSVSVDLILPATHKIDIMDFDYKQYKKDEFDIIWASPPCTNYSHLKNCWYGRKLKTGIVYTKEQNEIDQNEADKLVLKALEIINYFDCEYWFMENPQTGNLKNREIMKDIPFYDVDYCMYSDWGYKKRTRIWTNKDDFEPKLCDGTGACGNMIEIPNKKQHSKVLANGYEMINGEKVVCNTKKKRDAFRKLHKTNCGNTEKLQAVKKHLETSDGDKRKKNNVGGLGTSLLERYRIPEDLIFSLFLD
jgi:site-specific DNA-cytosine methylase